MAETDKTRHTLRQKLFPSMGALFRCSHGDSKSSTHIANHSTLQSQYASGTVVISTSPGQCAFWWERSVWEGRGRRIRSGSGEGEEGGERMSVCVVVVLLLLRALNTLPTGREDMETQRQRCWTRCVFDSHGKRRGPKTPLHCVCVTTGIKRDCWSGNKARQSRCLSPQGHHSSRKRRSWQMGQREKATSVDKMARSDLADRVQSIAERWRQHERAGNAFEAAETDTTGCCVAFAALHHRDAGQVGNAESPRGEGGPNGVLRARLGRSGGKRKTKQERSGTSTERESKQRDEQWTPSISTGRTLATKGYS